MKQARFLLPAELEMLEAAKFYEEQAKSLGVDFLRSVQMAVGDVEENPLRWPIIQLKIRRRMIPRFPYSILYRMDAGIVVVVAVMHMRRNPNYWIGRMDL